jgi:S-adenosylhomocysteine hydrolase
MQYSYHYPALEEILSLYKKEQLKNVYILGCQHILEPQAKMIELIHEYSVPKENIFMFGKIYSTSNEVLKNLSLEGFNISQPEFNSNISFDLQHSENSRKEFIRFLSLIKNPSKIVILDDGGELLKVVNDKFNLIPEGVPVLGVEQTSSGFRKLEKSKINFPIFNVARSNVKLIKESPLIAELGCQRVIDVFEKYNIENPRVLVVGLGPIGANMLSILSSKGYFVLGYDIAHHDAEDIVNLIKNNDINTVIGAVGANIVDSNKIEEIKDIIKHNVYLISMSSADREFPAVYVREKANSFSGVHSDVIWENIILVNNGFPITFKGNVYESTPKEIEKTIGLLLGSTLESVFSSEGLSNGFIDVPKYIIDIIEKYESN